MLVIILRGRGRAAGGSRSIKGGAVETGYSDLYVIYYILVLLYGTTPIHCSPLPLHPPCDEYPAAGGAVVAVVAAARTKIILLLIIVLILIMMIMMI